MKVNLRDSFPSLCLVIRSAHSSSSSSSWHATAVFRRESGSIRRIPQDWHHWALVGKLSLTTYDDQITIIPLTNSSSWDFVGLLFGCLRTIQLHRVLVEEPANRYFIIHWAIKYAATWRVLAAKEGAVGGGGQARGAEDAKEQSEET